MGIIIVKLNKVKINKANPLKRRILCNQNDDLFLGWFISTYLFGNHQVVDIRKL
jgi:hypothetical protein